MVIFTYLQKRKSLVPLGLVYMMRYFNVLGIKEKLYEKFPPFVDKDTFLNPLIEFEIVTRYVRFVELNLTELGIDSKIV